MYLTQYPFFNAVAVDTSGGRKKQACYYCGELTSKLPRHMMCKHATEKEVITALSFPNGSSSRKAAWHKLRSRGNYHHNMTFMDVGKSNLIVARKPNQSGRNVGSDDFLPCPHCRGFYRRQELWKHTNGCKTKAESQPEIQKWVQINSQLMLFGALKKSSNMLDNVLATMRNDDITLLAKSDPLILDVGEMLVQKHGVSKASDTSQTMRELSRLVIQLRKIDGDPRAQLSNYIKPSCYDTVVNAVRELCTFEVKDGQRSVGTPSLALKIGYALKKCVNVVVGRALRENNPAMERDASNFRRLLETDWSYAISHHSLTRLNVQKFNRVDVLPLAEDFEKLRRYIDKVISTSIVSLKRHPTLEDWSLLAQATLSRLVMFNKRRGGEASKLLVDGYQSRPNWGLANSSEIMKSLNKFERELSKR